MSDYFVDKEDCAKHHIFPGVDIFTTWSDRVMLSFVEFEPHAIVQPHSHENEQLGLLIEGQLEFTIGGETRVLRSGQMWRIPGGIEHSAVAGDRPVRALDVFCPVREDYQ